MSHLRLSNYKQAFSLIELVFVIAVLGIIATFAVPKLLDTRSNAIVTTVKQDIATITTAIQSQYMLDSNIGKITDSVNINEKNWKIEDKKLSYDIDGTNCVTIEVLTNTLKVTINENSNDLCKKLYDSGVKNITYDLM